MRTSYGYYKSFAAIRRVRVDLQKHKSRGLSVGAVCLVYPSYDRCVELEYHVLSLSAVE